LAHDLTVAFAHPANAGVLLHLASRAYPADTLQSESPDSISNVFWNLGAHPDVVEWLWERLSRALPEDCRWVVYRRPVLVHPRSGLLFAFGESMSYALRLPEPVYMEAIRDGAPRDWASGGTTWLNLAELGDDWVGGLWRSDEDAWVRAAYEYAGIS
jgi:hypothetical protein